MESTSKNEKLIVHFLKVIDKVLKEAKLQNHGLELSIDYAKMENSDVTEKDCVILIENLLKGLQTLKSQCTNETAASVHFKTDTRIDQDDIDWSLVQVKANKTEIDRRISAFIQQKQKEVDLLNRREFCNIVDTSQENHVSCARTDALFVPRFGHKSHIKVTRVGNTSTSDEAQALGKIDNSLRQCGKPKLTCAEPSVTERLTNIEEHLGFKPGGPVANDIYEVLKQLENRLLFLESLSPEYFNPHMFQANRSHVLGSHTSTLSCESMSLEAIDERIAALKDWFQKQKRN